MEKYYIYTYPSIWGMGSNWDAALFTEEALKESIRKEIERKKAGKLFSERMVGEWGDEIFCDSEDIFLESLKENEEMDFVKAVYDYPLGQDVFGVFRTPHQEEPYFRYDELFLKGEEIRYLPADYAGNADSPEEFGKLPVLLVLKNVFGYD